MPPADHALTRQSDMAEPAGGSSSQDGDAPVSGPLPLIGLIRNPKSHRNKGLDAPALEDPRLLVAEPHGDAALDAALSDFAKKGISVLAISGGDGTIRDVLTRGARIFGDNWPDIQIIPQGKTNALAFDLGLPRHFGLADALDAVRNGHSAIRRPLVIAPEAGDDEPLLGFFLGAGVFNAAIDAGQVAHRAGAFQSFAIGVTAIFCVLQALLGFGKTPWRQPYAMRFIDGATGEDLPRGGPGHPGTRFMAGLSTLRTFPLGIKPFADGVPIDDVGYFMIDVPSRRAVALLPVALFGTDGKVMRRLGLHRGTRHSFTIALEDSFILDGEKFPPGRYHVSAGPELRFIVP